jgi:MATE family multidrug resistance protein
MKKNDETIPLLAPSNDLYETLYTESTEQEHEKQQEKSISYLDAFRNVSNRAAPFLGSHLIICLSDVISVKMTSDLGRDVLAASNVITALQDWFSITTGAGFSATSILVAKKVGVNSPTELFHAGMILRQSWMSALFVSIPSVTLAIFCKPILIFLDQPEDAITLADNYFKVYLYALPLKAMLNINRKFLLATNHATAGLIIDIANKSLNLSLAYGLMFGKFGAPNLGITGLGIANLTSISITFLGSLVFLTSILEFRCSENVNYYKELWSLGWPISLKVGIELGATVGSSLMIGTFGRDQLAADEASYQYILLLSTAMFSLMETVSTLVSTAIGTNEFNSTRKIANAGLAIGLGISMMALALFEVIPEQLLGVFINSEDDNNKEALELAKTLLLFSGFGLIPDMVRNIYSGGINAYRDSLTPSLIFMITTIFFNIPAAALLAFPAGLKAKGVVLAKDVSMLVGAGFMASFWYKKSGKEIDDRRLKIANKPNNLAGRADPDDHNYKLLIGSDAQEEKKGHQRRRPPY